MNLMRNLKKHTKNICGWGDLLHNESRKYWGEALAEHKRLKEEYRPPAPEDLVLSIQELERIRADVQFVTAGNPTKEAIRQRLQYYRTLDMAEEQRYINGLWKRGQIC